MASTIPQTPQKPLPGGWTNTPAPQRAGPNSLQGLSSLLPISSSSMNTTNTISTTTVAASTTKSLMPHGSHGAELQYPILPQQPSPPKPRDINLIERAAKAVNDILADEARFPALDNYISQGFSYSPDYTISTSSAWTPFQKSKTYDLPDTIFEQYNQAQVSTMMGLFSDIQHAWISIDNALYLWNFTQPNPDLIGFEDQPNSITAVKLVHPKPGVFVTSISRLLVVATTNEIFLIGVAVDTSPSGAKSVALYHTRMSVPIRGINVQSIAASTKSGRIFFGGRGDDDVYELVYQQEEGWFSSRCARINHTRKGVQTILPANPFAKKASTEHLIQVHVDDSRNCLYTLSSASTIRVFFLRDSKGFELCILKTWRDIQFDLGHRVGPAASFNSTSISNLSVVATSEASRINLVATTSTGCRIYFSAVTGNYYGGDATGAPSSMMVHHVRFPPRDPANTAAGSVETPPAQGPPGAVASSLLNAAELSSTALTTTRLSARFPPGYFFAFVQSSQPTAGDTMFVCAPDSAKIAHPQDPSQTNRFPELGSWIVLDSRAEDVGLMTQPFQASSNPVGFGNELAVQFDRAPTEVAVLTNSGVHTFRRKRLVDTFSAAVRAGGGSEGVEGEVRHFVRTYGRAETIATALAVACGQSYDATTEARVTKVADPDVLEHARRTFIEQGGKPVLNENSVIDQHVPAIDSVRPSPRAEGLMLYVSRLLRSIWNCGIMKESSTPNGGLQVLPGAPLTRLTVIQRELNHLQDFLKSNASFIEGLSGPEALGRVSTKADEIALQGEHRALNVVVTLIDNVIEGIAFVLVLFDERVDEIFLSISDASRQVFRSTSYEGLFCTQGGKELAKDLVKAIVNRNIAQGSNVDTVTDALRRRCGSFCSADDSVIFKAQEQLKRASDPTSNSEISRSLLNESLRLLEKVAASLSKEQLKWAVEHYVAVQFFAGAIQLSLAVAHENDRGGRALAWIQDGTPAHDSRVASFEKRIDCYELIHQVIVAVDRLSSSSPEQESRDVTAAAKRRREAYEVINQSQDEVFQITLYDWYLSQGWSDRILEVQSPYVVSYLQRKSRDAVTYADLLWKYYSRFSNFIEAARVQLQLAKSSFDLSLEKRLEYLSCARANASTKTVGLTEIARARQSRQELMREISDMLDVAGVQSDIISRLRGDPRLTSDRRQEVIAALDGHIHPIDVLFNVYTDQAGYHDLCIVIYHIADHRNAGDIRSSWQSLIENAHQEAESQAQYPFEIVAERVRSLGLRLNQSDTTFPVGMLLPTLKKYAFEHRKESETSSWVVDIFLDLNIPFEPLLLTLEAMFYNADVPFKGRNRAFVAVDIIYVVSRWFATSAVDVGGSFGLNSLRSSLDQQKLFGSEDMAAQIIQVLADIVDSGVLPQDQKEMALGLRAKIQHVIT